MQFNSSHYSVGLRNATSVLSYYRCKKEFVGLDPFEKEIVKLNLKRFHKFKDALDAFKSNFNYEKESA